MKLNELKCICENINLDEYMELREKVKAKMEYPEWLGDFTRDDLDEFANYVMEEVSKLSKYDWVPNLIDIYLEDNPKSIRLIISFSINFPEENRAQLKLFILKPLLYIY